MDDIFPTLCNVWLCIWDYIQFMLVEGAVGDIKICQHFLTTDMVIFSGRQTPVYGTVITMAADGLVTHAAWYWPSSPVILQPQLREYQRSPLIWILISRRSSLEVVCLRLTHLPWTKWTPFRRRHFHKHFHEWSVCYFHWNFAKVHS